MSNLTLVLRLMRRQVFYLRLASMICCFAHWTKFRTNIDCSTASRQTTNRGPTVLFQRAAEAYQKGTIRYNARSRFTVRKLV